MATSLVQYFPEKIRNCNMSNYLVGIFRFPAILMHSSPVRPASCQMDQTGSPIFRFGKMQESAQRVIPAFHSSCKSDIGDASGIRKIFRYQVSAIGEKWKICSGRLLHRKVALPLELARRHLAWQSGTVRTGCAAASRYVRKASRSWRRW